MYKLINSSKSCIVEARTERIKDEFVRLGFSVMNETNDTSVETIKKPAPKRKAVNKNEGQVD